MSASHIQHPTEGTPIQALEYGKLNIPNQPIIPFIEGDGVGAEITTAMLRTLDHIVQKTYQNERQIHWMEIYAGEKATRIYGEDTWLPKETLDAINHYRIAIKGLLLHPSARTSIPQRDPPSRIRPLCMQRPVTWFKGVPSPVHTPEKVDMVVFRENSEDIYAGIEWEANSTGAKKLSIISKPK